MNFAESPQNSAPNLHCESVPEFEAPQLSRIAFVIKFHRTGNAGTAFGKEGHLTDVPIWPSAL
jgi:hypothetical protein